MIVLIIILCLLGILGYIAYKALGKIMNRSCIVAIKNDSGFSCNCETGLTQADCSSKGGLYQTQSCDNSKDWTDQCRNKLLGSCTTSTGCAYPSLSSDCLSAGGTWKAGNTCTTPVAALSHPGSEWT